MKRKYLQKANLKTDRFSESPAEWRYILKLSVKRHCRPLAEDMTALRSRPEFVVLEDTDDWAAQRGSQEGHSYAASVAMVHRFWHLLHDTNRTALRPIYLARGPYGIDIKHWEPGVRNDVKGMQLSKSSRPNTGKARNARHRPQTAHALIGFIGRLIGFGQDIWPERQKITSVKQLLNLTFLSAYVAWYLEANGAKGQPIRSAFGSLFATVREWLSSGDYKSSDSIDLEWTKSFLDAIPVGTEGERLERMDIRSCNPQLLYAIPGKIRARRLRAAKELNRKTREVARNGTREQIASELKRESRFIALMAMHELLIRWILFLPWPSRCISECEIGKNLFNRKIPKNKSIFKRPWVTLRLKSNPNARFLQYAFSGLETRSGTSVQCILPRELIRHYLDFKRKFRPLLVEGKSTKTLFVNEFGKPMDKTQLCALIGELTFTYGAKCRITPRVFRDIAARVWLAGHPGDYVPLSRMLGHSSIAVTKRAHPPTNESDGHAKWESLLDEQRGGN